MSTTKLRHSALYARSLAERKAKGCLTPSPNLFGVCIMHYNVYMLTLDACYSYLNPERRLKVHARPYANVARWRVCAALTCNVIAFRAFKCPEPSTGTSIEENRPLNIE